MSGCKQVKSDASAFAICQYMAENMGYDPSGSITPVDIYADAIEAAEREELKNMERAAKSVYVDDGFEFDTPLNCFLAQHADMRISWLFSDCSPDTQAEWYFGRVVAKVESFKRMAIADGQKPGSPEYNKTVALDIFDFIRKPAKRGGMGIVFDEEQKDPEKDALGVIKSGKATCIEFVILYTALANLAGIDAKPVHVTRDKHGVSSDHMKVGVRIADDSYLFMDLKDERIGMMPEERWSIISKTALLAHDRNVRAFRNPKPGNDTISDEEKESGFRRALDLDPDNCVALYNLGWLEYTRNDLQTALDIFVDAREKCPEDVDIAHQAGRIGKMVKPTR